MSIVDAIGHTPLAELKRVNPNSRVKIFAKLEGNNPGGSIKDRPAWCMVRKAIESGALTRSKTILEPTSGNTGIALAMIGASEGFRVKLTLPGCVSSERRHVLEAFGADVEITPPHEGTDGAIRRAHEILAESPDQYYMPNQFANPNNWLAHYETTGPEILEQTHGHLDVFVAGMGTTGTLMGMSRFLKAQSPGSRVVGVEPVRGHTIQGLKNMTESMVPGIYERDRLDDVLVVLDDEAFQMTRKLAEQEGIFAGISSGAAVAGAVRVAQTMDSGVVVTIICDRGDRYLSTNLFRSTCAKCPP